MPLHGTYEPSTDQRSREQVELYERTDGAEGASLNGMSVVILTSVGATSGKIRKIPLMRVEHEGTYAVVASLGGAPKNPVWYHNLVAEPHVELRDGSHVADYLAREVSGAERDLWWERSVAAFPPYADYALKTERLIPVFVLDRFPAEGDPVGATTTVAATSAPAVDVVSARDADDLAPATTDEQDPSADGLPYEATEAELERIEQSTELDDEIAEFWENARTRAGLGSIAVVGGLTVSSGIAPVAWSFGDNPVLADSLLDAVLAGEKTGTSTALVEFDEDEPMPTVGDLSIIVDSGGHPRALIRTTAVETVAFEDVSEEFAASEGEDDRSLESWRTEHSTYFRRVLGLDALPAGFEVVTETFELLYPRPER